MTRVGQTQDIRFNKVVRGKTRYRCGVHYEPILESGVADNRVGVKEEAQNGTLRTPHAWQNESAMAEAQLVRISVAESQEDLAGIRELFQEYAESLRFSLCFQNFEEELASIPGKYASPSGRLLLARCDGQASGCGALRPLTSDICEMKRLYVRPQFRGLGIGRALATRLMEDARSIGYAFMRLDTVSPQMPDADRLYRELGFYEIPAYYDNPQAGVTYMEYRLG